ncbi:transmembrane protein [Cystoisospora suis]|uniref:Transmembrane protein n=1 Tax=Cystoisospora suis TaxID=483139 RepID=A0A2C6KR74_9APIC|nr:transmembrane protein [Cystoisospora suis]
MANAREVAECLMLSIAFLGALSSLNRADCNFPLFVYLWWAFFHVPEDKKRQQRFMVSFIFLSIIQDIFYVLYWPIRWFAHDWLAVSNDTEGLHVMVTFFALLEIFLKLLLLALLLIPGVGVNTPEAVKLWLQNITASGHGRDVQSPLLIGAMPTAISAAPPALPPSSGGIPQMLTPRVPPGIVLASQ